MGGCRTLHVTGQLLDNAWIGRWRRLVRVGAGMENGRPVPTATGPQGH